MVVAVVAHYACVRGRTSLGDGGSHRWLWLWTQRCELSLAVEVVYHCRCERGRPRVSFAAEVVDWRDHDCGRTAFLWPRNSWIIMAVSEAVRGLCNGAIPPHCCREGGRTVFMRGW